MNLTISKPKKKSITKISVFYQNKMRTEYEMLGLLRAFIASTVSVNLANNRTFSV